MKRLFFGILLLTGLVGCSPGLITADHGGLGGVPGSRSSDAVGGGAVGDRFGGGIGQQSAGQVGSAGGEGGVSSPIGYPYRGGGK